MVQNDQFCFVDSGAQKLDNEVNNQYFALVCATPLLSRQQIIFRSYRICQCEIVPNSYQGRCLNGAT